MDKDPNDVFFTAARGVPVVTGDRSPPAVARLRVVVSSMASDAHTWNLVYLQLLLEDLGHDVTNLGACVDDDTIVSSCRELRPDLLVLSTVNGHGLHDGRRVIGLLRAEHALHGLPVVIGGKLGLKGPADHSAALLLRSAGFDAVFDADHGVAAFRAFLAALPAGVTELSG